MITWAWAELVFAMSLMVPEFFGGEGGVSGNRVVGQAVMGITYGPAIQVYYLIAVYTFVCVVAMYAFTQTPLGRMLNAVRDKPRARGFVGYNTQRIRYMAFILAGFFAGISGRAGCAQLRDCHGRSGGAARSGTTVVHVPGRCHLLFGPIIGAVLMVLAFVLFSELTKAGCCIWA